MIKKHLKGEGVRNLPKIGRPEKLSLRKQRKIVIKSKANPFLSSNELNSECNLASEVSPRTIRRILLYGRIAKKSVTDKKDNQQTISLVFRKKKLDTGKT